MKIDNNDIARRLHNGVFSKFELECYDDGVVLQRWEAPIEPSGKTEHSEILMTVHSPEEYYGYLKLFIPKPARPICAGTIIIMRMGENQYRAAFDNGKSVAIETFETIDAIEHFSEEFFT